MSNTKLLIELQEHIWEITDRRGAEPTVLLLRRAIAAIARSDRQTEQKGMAS
jgi:hypothetical protein